MLTDLYPTLYHTVSGTRRSQIEEVLKRMEDHLLSHPRRRGNVPRRKFIEHYRKSLSWTIAPPTARHQEVERQRQKALGLARQAGQYYDEHGPLGGQGSPQTEYRWTEALDYVSPPKASQVPYLDSGKAGLGLVKITRRRNYASSSRWRPSFSHACYLVGRNETTTFFAHPVPTNCHTVCEALQWMWHGYHMDILQRQGDIALIRGRAAKLPILPDGHTVVNGMIVHVQHAPLRLPQTGERIIVAKRAMPRVSNATRD